jgi:tRNA-specific adenosine deaminase 3
MCAMALLHSRIGRVVYALPDPAGGALGSVYRLHVHKQLNHRFDVWKGLGSGEAPAGVAHACHLGGGMAACP